jgi:hypothetical protein
LPLGGYFFSEAVIFMTLSIYFWQFCFGLHMGIGPPSKACSIGVAIATYVPTRPTIRNNILIARFIVSP